MTEPDLGARLRRTLHAVADTLEHPGAGWRTEMIPEPAARTRRRRPLVPLVLLCAATLAIGWVAGRSTDGGQIAGSPTTAPPTTTPPSVPAAPGERSPAYTATADGVLAATDDPAIAAACADAISDHPAVGRIDIGALGDRVRFATTDVDGRSGDLVVLSSGDAALICATSTDRAGAPVVTDIQLMPLALAAPAGGAVTVDSPSWYSPTPEGLTGPGWAQAIGRVGDDVGSIALRASDGTSADGQILNGWFHARVEVGADVALFDERVRWTAGGFDHEERLDLLDVDTPAEACAREGEGCVDRHVSALVANATVTASEVGAEWSATSIVEDGRVTVDEWREAREAFAQCMRSHGVQVSVVGDGLSYSTPASQVRDGASWSAPEIPVCEQPFGYVAEVREYANALDRVLNG